MGQSALPGAALRLSAARRRRVSAHLLLPLQLAGMAIGAAAMRRTAGFWRWGFAAFALMNFFSVFAHDLSNTSTAIWRVGATGDVVCTGITNTCVILAARGQADSRKYDGRGPAGTATALGIAAAATIAGYGFGDVPFVHEALYIGTSAAAFFCCLFLLVRRWPPLFGQTEACWSWREGPCGQPEACWSRTSRVTRVSAAKVVLWSTSSCLVKEQSVTCILPISLALRPTSRLLVTTQNVTG